MCFLCTLLLKIWRCLNYEKYDDMTCLFVDSIENICEIICICVFGYVDDKKY